MAQILIADDDPTYLDAFCEGMAALGHSVTSVSSGREVLPRLAQSDFDILFLDVVMGDGGGVSTLHEVHSRHDLPIVVITGMDQIAESRLFADGLKAADAKVHKSAPLKDLDAMIRQILGQ